MKRTSLTIALLAWCAPVTWAADALTFFNNWFVTGDYAVAGVGLRGTGVNGWATGSISMSDVPAGAEPIAAFLYWSTVETSLPPNARVGFFNGHQFQGVALGNPQNPNPPCWSSGGTSAPTGTAGLVYRADVLRYLPVDANNVRQANGTHTVRLPDSGGIGNGNVVFTNGASLVVIYRIVKPGSPAFAPLRAVVIYNGAFTMDKSSAGMTQTVAGFYEADVNAAARVTNIVANGQAGFSSPLSVNGTTLSARPFVGAQGSRWDNPTFDFNLPAEASSFSTLLTVANNQTCLTSAAIVASMQVKDSDGDGLLDIWELKGLHRNTQVFPATFGTCSDYPTDLVAPCVNLPAMGASAGQKDIFVQMDWMHGSDGHDHIPKLAALSAVAATFANHAINVHFDVGGNYQGNSFIIPSAYAQGGSDIDESTLVCHDTATHICDYHVPYPVLSFEFGFASVKNGNHLLNIGPHLAQNRKDVFHYGLFAHALGGPFNALGQPVDPFSGAPLAAPKSYSGIAHRPGGGFMVTFGLWRSDIPANDQVGSTLGQAGTIMHELGHNLGLGHAGLSTKPNCMPNYPSVMNYLYQTRGLTDATGAEHIDYSPGLLGLLSEASPSILSGALSYRVRFYGPPGPGTPAGALSQLHCDGTPLAGVPSEVRLEGLAVASPDWSNGSGLMPPFDVNYNGTVGEVFADQPDWSSLNLQQIGAGYTFGGLSVGAFASDGGAYASDAGAFASDAGALASDGGAFASDGGAFASDGGAFASDGGVFATDGGAFATDGGAFATDAGDLDQDTALLSSVDPPANGTVNGIQNTINSILLAWTPPDTGQIPNYNVYRCAGAGCIPSPAAPFIKTIAGGPAPGFTDSVNDFTDSGASCPAISTCYNTIYNYAVTSLALVNARVIESGFSSTAAAEVAHLFVTADNQTVAYGVPLPTPTYKISGDVQGTLSGVNCAYSQPAPQNAGTYPNAIICSGPATSSLPNDGVTYTSGTLTIMKANAMISVTPYSVTYDGAAHTAAGTAKGIFGEDLSAGLDLSHTTHTNAGTYSSDYWIFTPPNANYNSVPATTITDVIAKATATISVTPYSVTYDAVAHTAAGSAKGAGGVDLSADLDLTHTTHTNAGTYSTDYWTFTDPAGNYNNVAATTISDAIAQATATIVVSAYNVTYDGSAHTATGMATGVGGANLNALLNLTGTVHTNAGTYNDAWSFHDPAGNYKDAGGNVTDMIAQAPAIINVTPYNVIYDGKAHTATATATGVGGADLSAYLNLTGTTHTNVGTYNNDPWTFTDPNSNYKPANGTVNDAILWQFALSPLKSPAKLGSAVPVVWTLQDASGNYISSLSTLVKLESIFNGPAPSSGCVASPIGAYQTLYSLPNGSTGNSSFRSVSSAFQFNWDTTTATHTGPGCYTVKISLSDGTFKMTNAVQLK